MRSRSANATHLVRRIGPYRSDPRARTGRPRSAARSRAARRRAMSTWRHLGVVVGVKAAVGALVLAGGFRAVSDDDFSRVVLAQQWALKPHLDPTGSSWLPFPFWIYGA